VNGERQDFKGTNALILEVVVGNMGSSAPARDVYGDGTFVLVETDCFIDEKKDNWYEGATLFD